MISYKITVKGKVQGVSFRNYAKNKAQELGLCGYVKNLRNGDVELKIEGEEAKIYEMVDWCHFGSPRAQVESVEIETIEFQNFENFMLKY